MQKNALFFFLLFSSSLLLGQGLTLESIDRSNFSDIPQKEFFEGLSIPPSITYFEMIGHREDDEMLYQSGQLESSDRQGLASLRSGVKTGFATYCPPGWCYWYYLALDAQGHAHVINADSLLHNLIPEVKTVQDAIFYLAHKNLSGSMAPPNPKLAGQGQVAEVEDGFLLIVNRRTSDCPLTYADLLFHVSTQGVVTQKDAKTTKETGICY